MRYENGQVVTDFNKRARTDQSLKGIKTLFKENPEKAKAAAELLEVFQWSAEDIRCAEKINKIREELADVVNYCILMADACGLDLDEIVREKIKHNNEKYPVEMAFGSKEKYTELKSK